MPVAEVNPEVGTQAREALGSPGEETDGVDIAEGLQKLNDYANGKKVEGAAPDGSEAQSHGETLSTMTAEQAIKVCPYLGQLALEDPELAKQKAQEYIANPDKMADTHVDQESLEENADELLSLWDDLEAEFDRDERAEEVIDEEVNGALEEASDPADDETLGAAAEYEAAHGVIGGYSPTNLSESPEATVNHPEPEQAEIEAEPPIPVDELAARSEADGLIGRPSGENIVNRQATRDREVLDRRLHGQSQPFNSKERFGSVDINGIVSQVIAANPQACKAFIEGDSGALDILVREAMQLSEAAQAK